jgi:hypothetical protein
MLKNYVKVVKNPYEYLFEGEAFVEVLKRLISRRAADIEDGHATGEYEDASMGFVLLDPTAPYSTPSEEAILAYFTVGEEGERYLVNALGKGCAHRDHQATAGSLVYSQQHRLANGDLRWGHSAEIEGTIAAASGLSEIQDRYQAELLAVDFNYEIGKAQEIWYAAHADDSWFSSKNEPGSRYLSTLKRDQPLAWVPATA